MTTLVPARLLPNAVSLGVTIFYVAMIGGPSLAGLLLAGHGPAIVYAVNSASFLAVIAALIAMCVSSGRVAVEQGEAASQMSLAALKEGLSFVRCTPIIVQTMTLDFAATFFAWATALLPIFADRVLNVGARGLAFSQRCRRSGRPDELGDGPAGESAPTGRLVIWSVAVFGLATICFGLSRTFGFRY
jgi:hypothetical protein